jgi:hypothetical protein
MKQGQNDNRAISAGIKALGLLDIMVFHGVGGCRTFAGHLKLNILGSSLFVDLPYRYSA